MNNPGKSMYQLLEEAASLYPDHISLDYYGIKKTYTELVREIRQAAAILASKGISPGSRVVLCLPNIPQTAVFFYALNYLGAMPCMVHPLSTPPELEYYIKHTESKYLITLDMRYEVYKEVIYRSNLSMTIVTGVNDQLPKTLKVLYWLKQGRKAGRFQNTEKLKAWKQLVSTKCYYIEPHTFSESDPALILFSGGTSGTPKAVLLANKNMNALAEQVVDQIEPEPESDAMLCILPFFHGFGLGVCLHPVLLAGGCCILVPRFSQAEFAKVVRTKRPSYIAGVPTLYQALLNNPKMRKIRMDFLKAAFCGGDTTPSALIDHFNQFVKARGGSSTLREGYGLTECVTACTVMPADQYRQGSVGLPFKGTKIKIIDAESLTEQPPGIDGEICITGPTVMLGYLNQEQDTAETLRVHTDGQTWLHTGDLGYKDVNGFVYFRQRIKRIIKSSGYTVYPSQVEEVINSHPLVAASCVIGIPDQYSMQKIKAFVVYKGQITDYSATAKQLIEYAGAKLIKWAVPAEIEFCTQLPMTRLGKVSYSALENRN